MIFGRDCTAHAWLKTTERVRANRSNHFLVQYTRRLVRNVEHALPPWMCFYMLDTIR